MSGEIPQDRRELYDSAIAFLKDPSVASAPLTQKIEFLQGKGLTQDEIQIALREATSKRSDASDEEQSSQSTSSNSFSSNSNAAKSGDQFRYEAVPPAIPNRDWKDYFIMATASAGLFYGVYQLTKRYVIPQLLPEPKSKLEQDKELILEQFDKVEKLLAQIEQEHEQFKTKEDEKLGQLDQTITQLQTTLDETAKVKQRMESEFSSIKMEFNNMQNTLDSFTKTASNEHELLQLQDELRSLKSLIKSSFQTSNNISPTNGTGSKIISPNSTGFVPGAESIPSAADILANLDLGKKGSPPTPALTSSAPDAASVPAWKKARGENGSKASTPGSSIPEWQKAMNTGNSYESN